MSRPDVAVEEDAGRCVVDERALAMLALRMARVGESLGGEIVRESDVVARVPAPFGHILAREARPRRRHILVDRPQKSAMVDDHVMRCDGRESVGFPAAALRLAVAPGTDAQVAHLDIVRPRVDAGSDQIGRARCGERMSKYVWIWVVALSTKTNTKMTHHGV